MIGKEFVDEELWHLTTDLARPGHIQYENERSDNPSLEGELFGKDFYNIVKYIRDKHVFKFEFGPRELCNMGSPYRCTMFYRYKDLIIEIFESKFYESDSHVKLWMCDDCERILCYVFYCPLLSKKNCEARWETCGKIQDIVVELFCEFVKEAKERIEIRRMKDIYDKKCREVEQQIKTCNTIQRIVDKYSFKGDGIIDWM